MIENRDGLGWCTVCECWSNLTGPVTPSTKCPHCIRKAQKFTPSCDDGRYDGQPVVRGNNEMDR